MTREQLAFLVLAFPAAGIAASTGNAVRGWPGWRAVFAASVVALASFFALDIAGVQPGGIAEGSRFGILGIPMVMLFVATYAAGRGATAAAKFVMGKR